MLFLSLLSPLGVTLGMAARVYFSEHEHLAGRLLLSGLKASIIFNTWEQLYPCSKVSLMFQKALEALWMTLVIFTISGLDGVWRTDCGLEPLHIGSGSVLEPVVESNSSDPLSA